MSKLAKKIFVTAIMAAVVATVAIHPTAQAQVTAEELQKEIDALLATIEDLSKQIAALGGGTTGGGITGIPSGFPFTANLGQGSSGTAVMYLQMLLNSNSATQVAATGVGSSGSETQFYGPLTTAAVTAFHNLYASEILAPLGLTSGTGFFGAKSREKAKWKPAYRRWSMMRSGRLRARKRTPSRGFGRDRAGRRQGRADRCSCE